MDKTEEKTISMMKMRMKTMKRKEMKKLPKIKTIIDKEEDGFAFFHSILGRINEQKDQTIMEMASKIKEADLNSIDANTNSLIFWNVMQWKSDPETYKKEAYDELKSSLERKREALWSRKQATVRDLNLMFTKIKMMPLNLKEFTTKDAMKEEKELKKYHMDLLIKAMSEVFDLTEIEAKAVSK